MTNTRTAKVVSIGERRHSSLGPQARQLEHPSILLPVLGPFAVPTAFGNALALSLFIHIFVAFGIAFVAPDLHFRKAPSTTLDVVLVNSKSAKRPIKPDALAQANLDGGGNTDEARQAKTPLPMAPTDNEHSDDANLTRKVHDLEDHAQQLMTRIKSDKQVERPLPQGQQTDKPNDAAPVDLVEKSLQMVRLEAQVARNQEEYQQRPKRKFIGARAQEFRFSIYVDQWRHKIERIGTLNFPLEAKLRKLYGFSVQATIAIKADGTVERVDIDRSSGYKILDDAVRRIVDLSAPFAKFPEEIRKDTDIVEITRTWTFTRDDQVSAE